MTSETFKPMLAKAPKLDGSGNPIVDYPVIVQPKLDGIRASVVGGRLLTRTLKEVPNREIFDYLSRPMFEGLDGELVVGDPTAEGCMQRTTSFVMASDKTGEPWTYYVFDVWDTEDDASLRLDALSKHRLPSGEYYPVKLVESEWAADAEELARIEGGYLEAGHEGAILRDPSAPYKFGRSGVKGPLLKLKRFIDFEAVVIGVYEEQHNANEAVTNALGRTERSSHAAGKIGKGTLGGLVLRAINGPCEGVEFRCGTGYDAAQRAALWAEAKAPKLCGTPYSDLRGRTAKIKSFPVGVKDKPRFPVFLGWRDMGLDG
jgi:DNA ligase-1